MNGLADLLSRVPADERESVAGVVAITPAAPEEGPDADSGFDLVVHRTAASEHARLWLVAVKHYAREAPAAEQLRAARLLLQEQPAGSSDLDALAEALVEALLSKALDRWQAAHQDPVADFLLVESPSHVAKPDVIIGHSLGSLVVYQAKWIEAESLVKVLDQHRARPAPYTTRASWKWARHLEAVSGTGSAEDDEGPSALEDMHAPLTPEQARAVTRWFHSPAATPRKLPPRP